MSKIVLIGDSIVSQMYLSGATRALLDAVGQVTKLAVAGHKVADQLAVWQASAVRGDSTVGPLFIQCGINDVLAGTAAATINGTMATLVADIRANNPGATILMAQMDPAKAKLDATTLSGGADRYVLWGQLNGLYQQNYGASAQITRSALNDGTDTLAAAFDSGDGLHPNEAGNQIATGILRNWIDALGSDFGHYRAHTATLYPSHRKVHMR